MTLLLSNLTGLQFNLKGVVPTVVPRAIRVVWPAGLGTRKRRSWSQGLAGLDSDVAGRLCYILSCELYQLQKRQLTKNNALFYSSFCPILVQLLRIYRATTSVCFHAYFQSILHNYWLTTPELLFFCKWPVSTAVYTRITNLRFNAILAFERGKACI